MYAFMIIHTFKGTVKAFMIGYDDTREGAGMGKVFLTLDDYIDKRGITRYALSESTGIRYDTINKYYRNRVTRFDGYILAKICDALQCELAQILTYLPE